ncbi:type IV secretory system conjugative DNA transfer family protein [Acaricomes phytoseiuli]|uniref:type IV secretory system conjugative DNA transfer family protein n=1 Tax=Acaricomes phytoseiuli TaxID=291968 RepID=UPI0003A403BA|nr:TraM recognition domain-containing protein [Acaricomes phytoseiuli]
MSAVTRRRQNNTGPLIGFLLVVVAAVVFFMAVLPLGEKWAGRGYENSPQSTLSVLYEMSSGVRPWTEANTWAVLLWFGLPLLAALTIWGAVALTRPQRREIDRAARYMGRGRQIEPLTRKAVAKKAARLGIPDTKYPGVLLARHIPSGALLFQSFEDTCVDIRGPRAGKSTSRAIPAILQALGAVLVTENKPELFQVCAKARRKTGQVFLFDPQRITGTGACPAMFFNPLSTVHCIEDAEALAKIFDDATSSVDARSDGYFAPAGLTVVADYLLAAALSGQYMDTVFQWVNSPLNQEPADILTRHGESGLAARVAETQKITDKTRGIIFSEARRIVGFLQSKSLLEWLTPGPGKKEFVPSEFAASTTDTLFLLSQEGSGTAGPVIAALTKAVFNAAEIVAAGTGTGRLPVPLLAVLDEAANICRIKDLPEKYSHYGSKGILPMVLLQSYEQGEEVWGRGGMAKMWSAANVRIYGGNAVSPQFLSDLEKLVGTYEYKEAVVSYGSQGKSTSYQTKTDSILSVSDLASVPGDRMIILAGQSRPTLAMSLPWYKDRALKKLVKSASKIPVTEPVATPESSSEAKAAIS